MKCSHLQSKERVIRASYRHKGIVYGLIIKLNELNSRKRSNTTICVELENKLCVIQITGLPPPCGDGMGTSPFLKVRGGDIPWVGHLILVQFPCLGFQIIPLPP